MADNRLSAFSPGDEVTVRYGALRDEDGDPMTARVVHKSPHPGDDGVLIRYTEPDGSATENWVKESELRHA